MNEAKSESETSAPGPAPSRRKSVGFRLAAVLLATTITVLLVELVGYLGLKSFPSTRALTPDEIRKQLAMEDRNPPFGRHPELQRVNPENHRSRWATTNSLGLRNEEIAAEPGPSTFRILLLGGSVAWGYTSRSNEDTISEYLRAHLKQEDHSGLEGKTIEVLNAGVIGYRAWQEAAAYAGQWRRLKPHAVIALDGSNEVYAAVIKGRVGPPGTDPGHFAGGWGGLKYRFQRLKSVRLYHRLFPPTIEGIHPPSPQEISRGLEESWDRIATLAAQDRTLFIPVLQPVVVLPKTKPLTEFEDRLRGRNDGRAPGFNRYYAECYAEFRLMLERRSQSQPSLAGLDASDVFEDQSETMFVDLCHLTPTARQILARHIGDYLLDRLPSH